MVKTNYHCWSKSISIPRVRQQGVICCEILSVTVTLKTASAHAARDLACLLACMCLYKYLYVIDINFQLFQKIKICMYVKFESWTAIIRETMSNEKTDTGLDVHPVRHVKGWTGMYGPPKYVSNTSSSTLALFARREGLIEYQTLLLRLLNFKLSVA